MILEVIASFLRELDGDTVISLWRETETEMADQTEENLDADCVRLDLQMELLQEVTDLAWVEAKENT